MSTLYPRLLPNETKRLFTAMHGRDPESLRSEASVSSGHAVFAATGGTRVTRDELKLLATKLEELATANRYPAVPSATERNDFDRSVARHLHQHAGMTAGEASQRQVWAFLALVLVPHLCTWRFPMKDDGSYVTDRFKGTDLTRHTLARLWTRAHVLYDPTAADPYALLAGIGEADLDQIMSRRKALAATPSLVRAIVRAHMADGGTENGVPARDVLRDSLQRLLRLTAFLNLDWQPEERLVELVRDQRDESRKHLGLR